MSLQVVYVYGFVLALISAWLNLAKHTNSVNVAILGAVLLTPLAMRTIARSHAAEAPEEFPE